jgi:16S rRNA (adenine1518-N6/adenine1519-N6)-dimethyltransferase
MTTLLLERGLELSAFEIDYGFISILKEFFGSYRNFTLIEGDVMRTWEEVNPPGDYFLGNLPYNIGAALLAVLIEKNRLFKRMVVTIQKEVAARILAGVGSKDYSPLSILCASVYTVRPVLTLKGAAFYPPPRVDSQALRFEERADKPFYPPLFKTLVRHIFGARRKTIKNNLQSFLVSINMDGNTAAALLNSCGIDCQERPERIAIEEYIALAKLLSLDAAGGTDCAPEGLARQDT